MVTDTIKTVYDVDPLDPRGTGAPPTRRIKAVYGINLPTEVGAMYKRQKAVVHRADTMLNLYNIDTASRLPTNEEHGHGFVVEDGIVKELPFTRQQISPGNYKHISGDGTVPYWSLQHVQSWQNECNVSVEELEGAEHREILADPRFHEILLDYVCTKPLADESV